MNQGLKKLSSFRSFLVMMWILVPTTFLLIGWMLYDLPSIVLIAVSAVVLAGSAYFVKSMAPGFRIRILTESLACWIFFLCASVAVLITVAVAIILVVESVKFFSFTPIWEFLLGTRWNPSINQFGVLPLLVGTIGITCVALAVAVPLGLLSAIYLSFYVSDRTRSIVKPLLELLAGIPTVVYGFVAIVAVAPALQTTGAWLGLDVAAESALGVGLVMGIMIIPYISSLTDDVLSTLPRALKDGSLALGTTLSESIKYVMIPAGLPGIMAAIILAISRAIGETMIVVMAAGYSAKLSTNPLDALTTVTVQIVSLLTGDQVFNSPKTLAAFALGLTLFVITMSLNMIALKIIRHYREKYA